MSSGLNDCDWSPCSKYIVSCSDDPTSLIHSLKQHYTKKLIGHVNCVTTCRYTPTGNIIVTGSSDESVRIWDVASQKCVKVIDAHSGRVTCLQIDRYRIVTGSEDGLVRIWDMKGRCIRTLVDDKEMGMVSGLVLCGEHVIVFTLDSSARIWSMDGRIGKTLKGHINSIYWTGACQMLLSNDTVGPKPLILTGSEDGRIVGWDFETRIQLLNQECGNGMVLSIDSKCIDGEMYLVTGGMDGWVRVWGVGSDHIS